MKIFSYLLFLVLVILAISSAVFADGPIEFRYSYDEIGQLVKVVDSEGTVIEYVYDEVGNILEIKRSSIAGLPAIFGSEPRRGAAGATVVIEGRGFGATPAENTVRFNGVEATVVSASADALEVAVPLGATTGPIAVTVDGDTVTSDRDFVVLQVPVISSISPDFAVQGQVIFNFQVDGEDLIGSSFKFVPDVVPPDLLIESVSVSVDSDGSSALFTLVVDPAVSPGEYVAVATNAAGSSDAVRSDASALNILDRSGDGDSDGLSNGGELEHGTDIFNPDTDGDGLSDGQEVDFGSDPLSKDTDSDGLPDGVEVDICGTPTCAEPESDNDGDGLSNMEEVALGTDPSNPDTDGDDLSDGQEISVGTDPLNPDTDGDGFPDGLEVVLGSDPLDPGSIPGTQGPHEAFGSSFSMVNTTTAGREDPPPAEAVGFSFSALDTTTAGREDPPPSEAVGLSFSVENLALP